MLAGCLFGAAYCCCVAAPLASKTPAFKTKHHHHHLTTPPTHPPTPPTHPPHQDIRIEDLGPPDRIVAGFAPELYGAPLNDGDVVEQEVVKRGGLTYYQYLVRPHRCVRVCWCVVGVCS